MAEQRLLKAGGGSSDFAQFDATDTMPGANYPLPNVISPSQITSNENNYAPTGWPDADIVRLNLDTGGRAITGFAAWTNTRQKRIINTTANYGYIPCEHPDSSAANRAIGVCDHIIAPYGTLVLEYDDTSDRVRVVGNSFNPKAHGAQHKGAMHQVFPGATLGSDWGRVGFGISSGDNGTNVPTSTLPGAWFFTTLSSAAGISTLYFSKTVLNPFHSANGHITASAFVYLDTLSDGSNTYTFTFGFVGGGSSTTLVLSNEITIQYRHDLNSGKFLGVCRSSTSESTADLGVTVAANTPYVLTVCCSKSSTEARFYVDGVFAGRITSNVPGTNVGVRSIIAKSAGTTDRLAFVANMTAFNIM
jgi:hypothetical protein